MVYTLKNNLNLKLYEEISLIRNTEIEISNKYNQKKMRCPVHLSVGQELIPSLLNFFVGNKDLAISTHRSHAHYLAKGGNLNSMIAELYGKSTGCSSGKGGSMHLIDKNKGFYGSSSIVGNNIPVGLGLALGIKLKKLKNISIIYLGDAAVESGVFFESINLAILKNLPVLFICENNKYSVYTNIKDRQPRKRKIYKMVKSMGIETNFCDGYDIIKAYNLLKSSVKKIRKNSKPIFLEFSTYRWLEHCGPNDDTYLDYRPLTELNHWKKKDPYLKLKNKILKNKKNLKKIEKIEKKILIKIRNAFKFAENSKFPTIKSAIKKIYAK